MTRSNSRLFINLVLIVLFACSPSSRRRENAGLSAEEHSDAQRQLTQISQIWQELWKLDASDAGFLADPNVNMACVAYRRAASYQSLQARFDKEGLVEITLLNSLSAKVNFSGQLAAILGYARMKVGKPLGCGTAILSESYFVNKFDDLLTQYGSGSQQDKFDRTVVQTAYLRAVMPEIEDCAMRLYLRPDDLSLREYLRQLVDEAETRWHLSDDQLKVPVWFRDRVDH